MVEGIMNCSLCGGRVEWQGPKASLTHTEGLSCGATNSQVPEGDEDDENNFFEEYERADEPEYQGGMPE